MFFAFGKLYSQDLELLVDEKYSDLLPISELSETGDTLGGELNSLNQCLQYGEFWPVEQLSPIEGRIKEIAKRHFQKDLGLLLTWGTNGDCGREGEWYDDLTLKYGFRYWSVNCSCLVGNIPEMVEAYNSYALPFLRKRNGKNWKKKLEKEVLIKKRKVEFDLSKKEIRELEEIHLSYRSLKKYPHAVEKLAMLKRFYLNGNDLNKLDVGVCELGELEVLGLSGNRFKKFPEELFCLQKLKTLILGNNKLKSIPPEIQELSKLEKLYLEDNKLKGLPDEFSKLQNLKWLDLRENGLSELPETFKRLNKLETLILWDNEFKQIPKCLYEMKNLETLFIRFGNIVSEKEIKELELNLPNTTIK